MWKGKGRRRRRQLALALMRASCSKAVIASSAFFSHLFLLGKTLVSLPSPLFVALMTKCGSHRCPRVEEAIITSGDYVTLCPRDGLVSCEALASHIGLIQA